jgi:glycosyltransferase involved in cell wall biosynthesis
MKIIQILPELNAGGVERGTLEVGKYLTELGHESIVISNGGRLVEQLEAEGSRHITLPVHKKHLKSLKQVKVLRRLFEQERPDIIHLRSRVPAWIAWLAWRKMDPLTRPRLVTTVHGFYSVNSYSKIMTRGEAVICVSNSVKDYVLKNYPEVPEDKLTVIHRGVAPSELEYGYQAPEEWQKEWYAAFPETKDRKLLTLPGRITRLKGHEDLLKVIAALKDSNYHGLIVGGAHPKKIEYLDEIKELARTMRVADKITFTGHRSDLPNILSISSIVCSLTQQPESFGRTTLEALALGKPVIGYEHGGVGEILDTLLPAGKIPLGDTEGIVDRVKEWQHHPVKPAQTHPFTLQKMLSQTTELYQTLISSRR